jgi:hypothetical protein
LSRSVTTVNGEVHLSRAYYRCRHCGHTRFPFDDIAALQGRYSPAVRSLIALAGTLLPFRQAADDLLSRLAGLNVSASSCRRLTEQAGRDLRDLQRAGETFVPVQPASWDLRLVDDKGRRLAEQVLYLGVDAFAVPTRLHGGQTTAWRMLYVGLLYDPAKQHTVYLSDYDLNTLTALLRRYAVALGLGREPSVTVVALMDGGNGLEGAVQRSFSEAVRLVLDYYHAAEHVHTLAWALWGADSIAGRAWAEASKSVLWEQGGAALVERLQSLTLPSEVTAEGRECYRVSLGYFEGNVHRMDYASYRAAHWDVGSGPTEAGCKILKGRLHGTGMRWLADGSAEVGALRALYASGEGLWDTFFQRRQGAAA